MDIRRSLRTLVDEEPWHAAGYTFGQYSTCTDVRQLDRAQRFSTGASVPFHLGRRAIKHTLREADFANTIRELNSSHARDLLEFWIPTCSNPLLARSGRDASTFISWIVGSTDIYEDRAHQPRYDNYDPACRLCGSYTESRRHLLTVCAHTITRLASFAEYLRENCQWKHVEFSLLPQQRRWLWILGGGTTRVPATASLRARGMHTDFSRGRCVSRGIDKSDPAQCWDAYNQFREIEAALNPDSMSVYTDGSVTDGLAGSGIAIYLNQGQVHTISSPVGASSVDYAELFAVFLFLQWLLEFANQYTLPSTIREVHIFTDSTYVLDSLVNPFVPRKNFYVIEEIRNAASRLSSGFTFIAHWIPSHIDIRFEGTLRRIRQLLKGLRPLRIKDLGPHLPRQRGNLLRECIQLISDIDRMIEVFRDSPDGPS